MIGLGFLPSGMVKILDEPFTNPGNTGVFSDFLHAFYATGFYYNAVGGLQVLAAALLITQRFATLGALLFLPIIFNIAFLTLSTIGSLTPVVAVLMLLGILFLLLWDAPKLMNIVSRDNHYFELPTERKLPTYNRIQLYTGTSLIILPSAFLALSIPGAGAAAVLVVLVVGNLLSEWYFSVLRKARKGRRRADL